MRSEQCPSGAVSLENNQGGRFARESPTWEKGSVIGGAGFAVSVLAREPPKEIRVIIGPDNALT
ncbi:MAG: hypothetical protein JWN03_8807 [Nocardia sp.]|nr:hypothetical protein [Nocardia sp.]